jgi:hypothetical protein
VITRFLFITLITFSLLGVVGYLSCLENTPSYFLDRESPKSMKEDLPIIIAKPMIMIIIVCGIPINLHPCRISFFTLIGQQNPVKLWMHLLFTITFLQITLVLAIVTPSAIVVFSFLGAIL